MTRTFLFFPTRGVPGVSSLGFAVAGFLASECRSKQRPECSILKPQSRTHIDQADGREYPWANTSPKAVNRRYFFSLRGTQDER